MKDVSFSDIFEALLDEGYSPDYASASVAKIRSYDTSWLDELLGDEAPEEDVKIYHRA